MSVSNSKVKDLAKAYGEGRITKNECLDYIQMKSSPKWIFSNIDLFNNLIGEESNE